MIIIDQKQNAIIDTNKVTIIGEGKSFNGKTNVLAIYGENDRNIVLGQYDDKSVKYILNNIFKAISNNIKSYKMPK